MNSSSEDTPPQLPLSSTVASRHLVGFRTLCDYDSTSSSEREDEDSNEVEKRAKKSPRKRRQLKRATGGTVGICSKEALESLTNDPLLCESDKYDWFGQLNQTLDSLFPDHSNSAQNEQTLQGDIH
jgi:hypothetical protein